GPGAQTVRQRPVSRERHEAGSGPAGLPRLHVAAWDQNQHRPLEFPADQTPAADSVRRADVATDWRSARNGFLQRAEVGGVRLRWAVDGESSGEMACLAVGRGNSPPSLSTRAVF